MYLTKHLTASSEKSLLLTYISVSTLSLSNHVNPSKTLAAVHLHHFNFFSMTAEVAFGMWFNKEQIG